MHRHIFILDFNVSKRLIIGGGGGKVNILLVSPFLAEYRLNDGESRIATLCINMCGKSKCANMYTIGALGVSKGWNLCRSPQAASPLAAAWTEAAVDATTRVSNFA